MNAVLNTAITGGFNSVPFGEGIIAGISMTDVLCDALDVASQFWAVYLVHECEDEIQAGCDLSMICQLEFLEHRM
jgi:hypothetical protein